MPMKDEVWQTRSACGWGEVAHGKQVTIFGHLWLQWFKKRYVVEVRMQELQSGGMQVRYKFMS